MKISDRVLRQMVAAARVASGNAYCPYSQFPVGAAVLTAGGEIFSGCNVENASFGLASCAERNAVCQAVAQGQCRIEAVVIYTPTDEPTMPCGACRQVIHEFGAGAEIISVCDGKGVIRKTLGELLPLAFGGKKSG